LYPYDGHVEEKYGKKIIAQVNQLDKKLVDL